MNHIVFMVVFIIAVLVLGLGIFFYWRSTYGVWAHRRRPAKDASNESETIRYD